MLTKLTIFIGLVPLTAPLLAAGQSTVLFSGPVTLTVNSSRPLADMLDRVQQIYKVPINYEDPPYEFPPELMVSKAVTRAGSHPAGPRGGQLTVTFDQSVSSAYQAAVAVVNAYAAAGLPGLFQVIEEENGGASVIPIQYRAVDGAMRSATAILSRPITFPSTFQPVVNTLQSISTTLGQESGFAVHIIPVGMAEDTMANLSASGQTIRDIVAKLDKPMAIRAFYDPNEKAYYVNLEPLVSPPLRAPGTRPTQQRQTTPQQSPFFKGK